MIDSHHGWNKSYKPLIIGFLLSIILTLAAYWIVVEHYFRGLGLIFAVIGLATVQVLIQLVCFLHMGMEAKPRWTLMSFFFMIVVVVSVIGGSLWIMYNINYNIMMPTMDMQHGYPE